MRSPFSGPEESFFAAELQFFAVMRWYKLDKYEYKLKIDQMKALIAEKDYLSAAEIADSINWRKVRNVNLLFIWIYSLVSSGSLRLRKM